MEDKLHIKNGNSIRIVFGDAIVSFLILSGGDASPPPEPVPAPAVHVHELHKHPFYELRFATQGNFSFDAINHHVSLPTGEMLVLCPDTYHYSYIPSEEVVTKVISFSLEKAEGSEPKVYDIFHALLNQANMKVLTPGEGLLQKARSFTEAPFPSKKDARSLFHLRHLASEIVLELFDLFQLYDADLTEINSTGSASQTPNYVLALDFFVHTPDFPLSEIAAELGYSVKHTSRLIKQIYGTTLTQIRKQKRLSRARALLLERPDLDIQQICNQTGFQTITLFYSVFRQTEGCTPTEYRKLHGVNSGAPIDLTQNTPKK